MKTIIAIALSVALSVACTITTQPDGSNSASLNGEGFIRAIEILSAK